MAGSAVLYVRDLLPMRSFYQGCFGLFADAESSDDCVLTSDAWELWLVTVRPEIAATIVITNPPTRRAGTAVKLAFDVDHIESLRGVVEHFGGLLDPPEATWAHRGKRHLDGIDPEGNVIQLRERA